MLLWEYRKSDVFNGEKVQSKDVLFCFVGTQNTNYMLN